jgi:hypothetical protein
MSSFLLSLSVSSGLLSSPSTGSLGLNNISPDRDGIEGRKKGVFSGFFGGSIGLLRTCGSLI